MILLTPMVRCLTLMTELIAPPTMILASIVRLLARMMELLTPMVRLIAPMTRLLTPMTRLLTPATSLLTPIMRLLIPNQLVIATHQTPNPQFWGNMKPSLNPAPPELGAGGGSPGFITFIARFSITPTTRLLTPMMTPKIGLLCVLLSLGLQGCEAWTKKDFRFRGTYLAAKSGYRLELITS
jgi:hypothetical protein